MKKLVLLAILGMTIGVAEASVVADPGEVRVPLNKYQNLLNQAEHQVRPAPARYAIGNSQAKVEVSKDQNHTTARVTTILTVETFENEWTLVPILPPAVALSEALVDGKPVQLVQGPDGLSWATNQAKKVQILLRYAIDPVRSRAGYVLAVPVPKTAATELQVVLPDTDLDIAVVPSADLQTVEQTSTTQVKASVPATSSILISWRTPTRSRYAMNRAHYIGELQEDAVVWSANIDVEVFAGETVTLELMPNTVTLADMNVDGKPATILERNGNFATVLQGRGKHKVTVKFHTPILHEQGPPQARLRVPRVPISRFDLVLPADKELRVTPSANVVSKRQANTKRSTVFLPMQDNVAFSWVDAIPEALRAEVRANATLYHLIHAEESVLQGRALIDYDITRGDTNRLTLLIPADVQINRIAAPSGGISDWGVIKATQPNLKTVEVFLDRAVKGRYVLTVDYERLLPNSVKPPARVDAPLLTALNVHRQRGMAALLVGPELALHPLEEKQISRVGENQLPAFVRNQTSMKIAHTYKYTNTPTLVIQAVVPERKQGKFDAQIDTLVSVGEATLRGSATVEISVKSGSLRELDLRIPADVNVLNVIGPSIRSHQVQAMPNEQLIHLEFTQEMEGQFPLEINYEHIMSDAEPQAPVPLVLVNDAEVEYGRVAVEALTAAEIVAAVAEQLSSVDINELPQQLILKTTNPILLAYRYGQAPSPVKLELKITRHRELDVQVANIEHASYKTLFTGNGISVTTATLLVRNSRRQFLRLQLPADSEVWSVFVDGKPEKPAHSGEGSSQDDAAILIKMINSTNVFPVEIVYATKTQELGFVGSISARLPHPDIIVTHTRWDVYLPLGPRYQTPETNLRVLTDGSRVSATALSQISLMRKAEANEGQPGQPLRLDVPAEGVHFALEKLYANQSKDYPRLDIRYTSVEGNHLALLLSAAGTVLVWLGIVAIGSRRIAIPRRTAALAIGLGVVLLIVSMAQLGASPLVASSLTLLIALGWGIWFALQQIRLRRQQYDG